MWWAWAVALVAFLIVVTMRPNSRGATGNTRKDDLPAHQRVEQIDSNWNTTLGGSLGGV